MTGDLAPLSGKGRQDEEPADGSRRRPAETIASDLGRQSLFGIVPAERLFHRGEFRLHLDDQQRTRRWMPRENIDRTTLPADGKRDFRLDLPTEFGQQPDDPPDDGRMSLVQQAVDLTATKSDGNHHVGIYCAGVTPQLSDVARLSAFRSRDVVLRKPGGDCDVDLSPAESMTKRAQEPADALVVRAPMVATTNAWAVISGLPPAHPLISAQRLRPAHRRSRTRAPR